MKASLTILFLLFLYFSIGQDKKVDKLEMLYDQGHYAKVYRKANKLMADPLYDYSSLPEYYKSLSIFHLAQYDKWLKKNPKCIFEAVQLFDEVKQNENYRHYIRAHYFELSRLKTYLISLNKRLKNLGLTGSSQELTLFLEGTLRTIDTMPEKIVEPHITTTKETRKKETRDKEVIKPSKEAAIRERLVVYAKSLIGIKYSWAGNTEDGFDCSGFTVYVHKKYGVNIARTASDQQKSAQKIKLANAQKADLVFFGSGTKITHVGIVVSDKSKELCMIHASTSKGIIVTNIAQSTYWKPKLKSAGSYILF